ncbi:hypothetical protein DTO021C3_1504 [Paecilomyces variotii]|nr:hypothetical protein DTO021C3_1504 [Paecilomyces variotii]
MLIDGEKWACEACVRGHRVSSCHHSDRPLTHINKKGRPVSQCTHCRGLRKSRTTHVKCECGDKKKNNSNNNNNNHSESDSPTGDNRLCCGCTHGQRCTCALKKEHHLDPVPETGLPLAPPAVTSEPKKPRLTSTKSESTLTVFRDGHHKPAYKHNDMAHKCGVPYTIPRSHTIHSTTDIVQRSADALAGIGQTADIGQDASNRVDQTPSGPQRLVKSEHGSPESAPVPSLEQINTQMPPLDISSFSPFGTTESPLTSMTFQDSYQEQPFFTSPEADFSLGSAGLSAPPVDWSSFPLYASDVSATAESQPPSYASFDYNAFNNHPGIAASSSGDISEIDEFGPLPGLGQSSNDIHDLNSVSDGSDSDQYRFSSSSSFIGLPQAQLLSSTNLESINIDDFLKSANESTAALEHQLQASMGLESKPMPSQSGYAIPQAQLYPHGSEPLTSEPLPDSMSGIPMTTSPTDAIWAPSLYDSASVPLGNEQSFPQNQWSS